MAASSRPLKAQNAPWIWGVVLADAVAIIAFAYPATLTEATVSFNAILRMLAASLAPVVVLLLTSLLTSDAKATLVFWRVRDALPGHRAFSLHAQRDSRIDLDTLEKNVGKFPESPRDQNSTWYRLYKKVESDISVTLAHRNYLLFRDIAGVSLVLLPVAVVTLYSIGARGASLWFAAALFGGQYVATAIAAGNHGVRLVTNVLALHSSKRRSQGS